MNKKYKFNKKISLLLSGAILLNLSGCSLNGKDIKKAEEYISSAYHYIFDVDNNSENKQNNIETSTIIASDETTKSDVTTTSNTLLETTMQAKEYYYVDQDEYVTVDLNQRQTDDKDGKILQTIDKYQKIKLIKTNDNWDYVSFNGIYGYVSSKYTKELSNPYIEVDISDQKVYLYKDKEKIITDNVVTGKKDIYDTRLGCNYIYVKQQNKYLKGIDFNVFVNYWMPFDKGIGLHDASWRSEFGNNIYIQNGSHGCVNLKCNTAKKIYNNVEANKTKVLVHK